MSEGLGRKRRPTPVRPGGNLPRKEVVHMPIDPAKRIAKWNARFNTERIKGDLDDMRPQMYTAVQGVFPLIAAMELEVKQTLDAAGISVIQYPFYLCFGREMWSLTRKDISGESAAKEAAVLVAKWVARGLTQAVLQAIRTQVFNISAPAGP